MVSRAAPTVMIHKNTMKEEKPMSKSQLIILGVLCGLVLLLLATVAYNEYKR
jgi:hypothetical protein